MATSTSGSTTIAYSKYIKLSTFFAPQSTSSSIYNSVTFFLTPEISESRSVTYVEISDILMPASILIYMGSPSRQFTLNAKFLARSKAEADIAFRNKSLLESWCVTGKNLGTDNLANIAAKAGNQQAIANGKDITAPNDPTQAAPTQSAGPTNPPTKTAPATPQSFSSSMNIFAQSPPPLALEGYGGQFRKIPVVINSLNITYPADVDYIQTSNGQMVPILQDIAIGLKEAREISGFKGAISGFSLSAFKAGTLEYW